MKIENQDELITNAINNITEKLSSELIKEFLKLPTELQINMILIKTAQLLLANILCHVATTLEELKSIADGQGIEIKELTLNCAFSGFSNKFNINKH